MQLFNQFGEIVDVLRKEDFCFMEYKETESALKAIQSMHGQTVSGSRIIVEGARPKEDPK